MWPSRSARRALTLVEMTLALALVVVLLSAMVLGLSGWGRTRRLEEGADRFQTLLYMAKADAANLGRKLRLSFATDDSSGSGISVLWESEPLTAPQQFSEYSACTWLHHMPTGLVYVARSELTGPSAYALTEDQLLAAREQQDEPMDAVTFYPDGSCDWAVIELASTAADSRRAVFEIHGITGSISRRILTASELEEEASN